MSDSPKPPTEPKQAATPAQATDSPSRKWFLRPPIDGYFGFQPQSHPLKPAQDEVDKVSNARLAYPLRVLPTLYPCVPLGEYATRRHLWLLANNEDFRHKAEAEAAKRKANYDAQLGALEKAREAQGPNQQHHLQQAFAKLLGDSRKILREHGGALEDAFNSARKAAKSTVDSASLQDSLRDYVEKHSTESQTQLLATLNISLTQGLAGAEAETSAEVLELSKDLRENGYQPRHDQLLTELYQEREMLKVKLADPKAELGETSLICLRLLEAEKNAADARKEPEKKGRMKVNEMDDSAYPEPVLSSQENDFAAYRDSPNALGLQEDSSVLLADSVFPDPRGSGQCDGCGLEVPTHLESHVDLFSGRTVRLCPMCHCAEHLDFTGFQRAGRMVWAPSLPQSFFSLLTVLALMSLDITRVKEQFETLGELLESDNPHANLKRLLPEGTTDEAVSRELKIAKDQYDSYKKKYAPEDPALQPGLFEISERIRSLHVLLEQQSTPLIGLFGADPEHLDPTDPLFIAEQLKAEGFLPENVQRLREEFDALDLKDAKGNPVMSEDDRKLHGAHVARMDAQLARLDGLRFMPDLSYFAPLVLGPWKAALQAQLPLEQWALYFPTVAPKPAARSRTVLAESRI